MNTMLRFPTTTTTPATTTAPRPSVIAAAAAASRRARRAPLLARSPRATLSRDLTAIAKGRRSSKIHAASTGDGGLGGGNNNDDDDDVTTSTSTSASTSTSSPSSSASLLLVGEDAAAFDLASQSLPRWLFFGAELAVVMVALWFAWLSPETGLARSYVGLFEDITNGDTTAAMVLQLSVFAILHSGLAFLRPYGEAAVGARAWRVLFAVVSLPLAASSVAYFINHRYDGAALWDVRGVPGVHALLWAANYVSFFLLYPSTFNLLEVAAVDEPRLHLWETGVARITRHPQAWGQALWCAAHTAWIGSSFMVATSLVLMLHHAFSVPHGDFRLRRKHGEAFDAVRARTSVVPFAAIVDGRQRLPDDYWKEWVRAPYLAIAVVTLGAYLVHPLMQAGSYSLKL